MRRFFEKMKEILLYDADRAFYAKVFPGSVPRIDLMKIRRMAHSDLPSVLHIEGLNYQFPWSENVFSECLRAMNYTCWVCEEADKSVIGYYIVSMAAGEVHVMNVCVDPALHRLGAGRKMLQHMIEQARSRAERIFLEVRPSNVAAIKLYKSLGFVEIGIRKDYYPAKHGREDAVMLALELMPSL